jgi:hypothetical protein
MKSSYASTPCWAMYIVPNSWTVAQGADSRCENGTASVSEATVSNASTIAETLSRLSGSTPASSTTLTL